MGLYKNAIVSACSVFIVFIYTNFIDDLDILFADRTNEEVKALYQVGVALVPEGLDGIHHLIDVIRGRGIVLGALDPQSIEILEERLREAAHQ